MVCFRHKRWSPRRIFFRGRAGAVHDDAQRYPPELARSVLDVPEQGAKLMMVGLEAITQMRSENG